MTTTSRGSSQKLPSISLFTGAGGLDLGLHEAGFSARIAVECDEAATRTLSLRRNSAWWGDTHIERSPIEAVTSRRLLRAAGLRRGEAALLAGGPPCQPFSKSGFWHSGRSKRLSDPRAVTIREYLRVLEDTLPEAFLLENVPGLAFGNADEGLRLLRSEIAAINRRAGVAYSFAAAQLRAVELGVPQTRERVFVIGHRGGRRFDFDGIRRTHQPPRPLSLYNGSRAVERAERRDFTDDERLPAATAWDAIGHLQGNDDPELKPRGKYADLLPTIPEGHNYLYHTERGGGCRLFGWRRRYWSMLLKLAKARPSWTLTAQPGPAIGPFHWHNRRLSAEELCALQTLPSGYAIWGNVMDAYRQLGNAVPSALADVLGREIRRQLLGDSAAAPGPSALLPNARNDTPPEEPVLPVPAKYRHLIGDHAAHPGTGSGPGSRRRQANGGPS